MKKIILLTIVMFLNCVIHAQDDNCTRKADFGSAKICLPKVEGYEECYQEPIIKLIADATEIELNEVLGFYINSKTYSEKDSLLEDGYAFDDYFKVYGTKQIKDFDADRSVLEEMNKMLSANFIEKYWGEMEKEIDKIGMEIEVGTPITIKNYSLNKNSFTYVLLTKYKVENEEAETVAMTMNGLLLNKRLVWLAYYKSYKNKETIKELEERSNYVIEQILKGNK